MDNLEFDFLERLKEYKPISYEDSCASMKDSWFSGVVREHVFDLMIDLVKKGFVIPNMKFFVNNGDIFTIVFNNYEEVCYTNFPIKGIKLVLSGYIPTSIILSDGVESVEYMLYDSMHDLV